jgi:hypothetical protein
MKSNLRSAMLCWRRLVGGVGLLVGLCLGGAVWVHAIQFNSEERLDLPTQNVISDSWYAAAQEMQIAGTLQYDAYIAASKIVFQGVINQDLCLLTQEGLLSGVVGGDLRAVGDVLKISTRVHESLVVVARDLRIENNAYIKEGMAVVAQKFVFTGTVLGKADILGGDIELDGSMGGDVSVRGKKLRIGPNARIDGLLTYYSGQPVVLTSGARAPRMKWINTSLDAAKENWWVSRFGKLSVDIFFGILFSLTFLLVGLLLVWLMPSFTQRFGVAVQTKFWPSLGWGLVLLIGIPLGIVLLLISILGIPLALILGLLYLGGIFLARLGVAYWVGALIFSRSQNKKPVLAFLTGYVILALLSFIPVLGFVMNWAAIVIGLGALALVKNTPLPTGPKPASVPVAPVPWEQPQPQPLPAHPAAPMTAKSLPRISPGAKVKRPVRKTGKLKAVKKRSTPVSSQRSRAKVARQSTPKILRSPKRR